jgi:hypothetical protein
MLRLQNWRPINFPGDTDPPVGARSRMDFLVLAALLTDLALFAIHIVPRLRSSATSPAGFVFLLLVLLTMWLGPFLGVLLRRGRGAALICYGIAKLAVALAMLGWWWGHELASTPPPDPRYLATWVAWHLFGVVLSVIALLRRSTSRATPASPAQ